MVIPWKVIDYDVECLNSSFVTHNAISIAQDPGDIPSNDVM